jgi:hypothetical protein
MVLLLAERRACQQQRMLVSAPSVDFATSLGIKILLSLLHPVAGDVQFDDDRLKR